MKKKQLLALSLCLAMLLCVAGGCSNSSGQTSESPVETATTAAAETAPSAPDTTTGTTEQEPVDNETSATMSAAITYPLTGDDMTLTYWFPTPAYGAKVEISGNDDYLCVSYAEEATGVHLDFIGGGEQTASEQFNLMIASGDWADLIPVNTYYVGGLSQAYTDEVVFDMTDLVNEYMPDYLAVLKAQDEGVQNAVLNDGMTLAFSTIADGTYSGNGPVTRGDWLSQIDYEFTNDYITLTEYVDLMRLLKDKFGASYGYYLNTDGQISSVAAAFDTLLPSLSTSSTAAYVFNMDGSVTSGWTADGTRNYVEWLAGLISEGLIDKDFFTSTADQGDINTACANGVAATWNANADKLDELVGWANDENKGIVAQAVPPVVADGSTSATTKWLEEVNLVSKGMSISAASDKGELACKWMNYFWTEEGNMLANYGVKGKSYDIDEGGNWYWLDLVTNEPHGVNCEMATAIYTFSRFVSYYSDHDKLLPTFTDNAVEAVNLWTQDGTSERRYPNFAGLTTDETDSISTKLTDICTYGQQMLLSFMTGTKPLNDDTWAEYLATMNNLGLTEVVALYQNAYGEYLAGTRYIAMPVTAPGAGGPPPM